MSFDIDISYILSHLAGFLTFATAGLSLYLNTKKADLGKTTKLIGDLQKSNEDLAQTDYNHQQELNASALKIQELTYKNKQQEDKMKEYYQIITDRDPETKQTLALLVSGVSDILERLDGAEVVKDEQTS